MLMKVSRFKKTTCAET